MAKGNRRSGKKKVSALPQRQAEAWRTEKALRASRDFRLQLFDELPSPIWAAGPDAKCNYFNKSWLTFTGRMAEQELGDGWSEGVHPDDRTRCFDTYLQAFQARVPFEMEYRLRRHDGEYRWIVDTGRPFYDHSGSFTGYIGSCLDITERKRAEAALRESEAFKNRILENSPDCIKVLDLEGRLLFMSKGGMERLEIGDAAPLLNSQWVEFWQGEDKQKACAAIEAARAGGIGRFSGFYPTATGKPKWWDVLVTPLLDASGAPEKFLSISRDITEHRRADEALRLAEEKYRSIFENAVEGIFQTTSDGRYISANPALARIYGYESSREMIEAATDIRGQVYVDPERRNEFTRMLKEHDAVTGFESQVHRKDCGMIWISESARAVRDRQGALLCYEGTVEDITERKRLEHQLIQSQKMEAIGRLAGGVAHDFNNVLTAIMGYSELLLSGTGSEESRRRHTEQIKKAAERAASLTSQLLAFSRRQVLTMRVLDLNDVVAVLEPMLRRLIGEDITLVTVPDLELERTRADMGQIEQVIMNLVVNARDAMPRGGTLTIETANVELDQAYVDRHGLVPPGAYVKLTVSDTGCGMDAETQSYIFEPFFTTKEPGRGTGLGLSTVYGVIKQSGGYIWVYSEPGQGTTFKIYLPRVEDAVKISEPGVVSAESPRGTETVLLAEDDEGVRELAGGALERRGYSVLMACGGEEALLISGRHAGPIHLLVTDVVMPGISGRELAERLVPLRPDMKVLYMSGYTDDAVVRYGVLVEEAAYLQKPFTPDVLLQRVRQMLGRSDSI